MGIFDKLFAKKSNDITLGAPVAGEAVALSQVSDPTFGSSTQCQARSSLGILAEELNWHMLAEYV